MQRNSDLQAQLPTPTSETDELEDHLDLQDEDLCRQIAIGHREYMIGKARPVARLLADLRECTNANGLR